MVRRVTKNSLFRRGLYHFFLFRICNVSDFDSEQVEEEETLILGDAISAGKSILYSCSKPELPDLLKARQMGHCVSPYQPTLDFVLYQIAAIVFKSASDVRSSKRPSKRLRESIKF